MLKEQQEVLKKTQLQDRQNGERMSSCRSPRCVCVCGVSMCVGICVRMALSRPMKGGNPDIYPCIKLHKTFVCKHTQVREHVRAVKTRLQLGLRVLCDVVGGNPRFAATKLEELQELCQPLLSSTLVGECLHYFYLSVTVSLSLTLYPAVLHTRG